MNTTIKTAAITLLAGAALFVGVGTASADVAAGTKYYNGNQSCSIGEVGTITDHNGSRPAALTAGHCTGVGERPWTPDGQTVGTTSYSHYNNAAGQDLAVVNLAPGVRGTAATTHVANGNLGFGTVITKEGYQTGSTPAFVLGSDRDKVYTIGSLIPGDSGGGARTANGGYVGQLLGGYPVVGPVGLAVISRADTGLADAGKTFTPGNVVG